MIPLSFKSLLLSLVNYGCLLPIRRINACIRVIPPLTDSDRWGNGKKLALTPLVTGSGSKARADAYDGRIPRLPRPAPLVGKLNMCFICIMEQCSDYVTVDHD